MTFAGGLLLACALTASAQPTSAPQRGERAYLKCASCHATERGRNDHSGPTLHAIVGRRIAGEPRYDYSPALRTLARRHRSWNADLLNRFIEDPDKVAPRTTMSFHGLRNPRERADLISYLETLRQQRRR